MGTIIYINTVPRGVSSARFWVLTGQAERVVVLEAADGDVGRTGAAEPVQGGSGQSRQLLLGAVIHQDYLQESATHGCELLLGPRLWTRDGKPRPQTRGGWRQTSSEGYGPEARLTPCLTLCAQ